MVPYDRVGSVINRLVNIDVPVSYLEVESAIWICANPGFILNGCALTAEVRERDQITQFALLTLWEAIVRFQESTSLPLCFTINEVYIK